MGTTFRYRNWADMTHVEITRFEDVMEPGVEGSSQPAMTKTIIEGTGIVTMTADSNATTGARRRIDDIRRILSSPGGRLQIIVDGVTWVDHSSEDYKTGSGETTDAHYGPVLSCDITEVSGSRCAIVRWRAEYRLWQNVTSFNPIIGFVCRLQYVYDRTGYLTLHRTGVLTVRRSAGFPNRDGLGLTGTPPPTVTGFLPTTLPFGGGQSPTSAGITTTTIGNNPDLYRRFVAGPIFKDFIRESQDYYVDETYQKLFFAVTDRQVALAYPAVATGARVDFVYEMRLDSGPGAVSKKFRAELTGRPDTPKSQLLTVAVAMSKNRIMWSSADGAAGDVVTNMTIEEPDMMNQNTLTFTVTALGTNLGFAFTPQNGANIFASIMTNVEDPPNGSTAKPDAYGLNGLVTLTDFIWTSDPPGTHVSPNTTGASLMGKVPYGKPVAQVVSISAGIAMANAFGEENPPPIPPGDAAAEASEAPQGYFRVEGSMRIDTDNSIVIGNAATETGPDRAYQFGKPRVIVHEMIAVQRKNDKPSSNIAFTPLPWGHIEIGKTGAVSPAHIDANGNLWYTGLYERRSRVLSSAMSVYIDPVTGRRFSYFGSSDVNATQYQIPQQINPQIMHDGPLTPFIMPPSNPAVP